MTFPALRGTQSHRDRRDVFTSTSIPQVSLPVYTQPSYRFFGMEGIGDIAAPARGSVPVTAVDELSVVAAVNEEPSVVVGVKEWVRAADSSVPAAESGGAQNLTMQRIGNIAPSARGSVLVTAVDEPVVAAVKEPSVVVGVKGPLAGASAKEKEPPEISVVAAGKQLSVVVDAKEELSVVAAAKEEEEEPFVVAVANNAKELFGVLVKTAKELFDVAAAKDAPSVICTELSVAGLAKSVAVVTEEQWPAIAAQPEPTLALAVSAKKSPPVTAGKEQNWPLTIIGNEVMLCSEVCGRAGCAGHAATCGQLRCGAYACSWRIIYVYVLIIYVYATFRCACLCMHNRRTTSSRWSSSTPSTFCCRTAPHPARLALIIGNKTHRSNDLIRNLIKTLMEAFDQSSIPWHLIK